MPDQVARPGMDKVLGVSDQGVELPGGRCVVGKVIPRVGIGGGPVPPPVAVRNSLE